MKKHSSPEERLLHIIKGAGKNEIHPAAGRTMQLNKAALPKEGRLLSEIKQGRRGIRNAMVREITDRAHFLARLNKGLLLISCLLIAGVTVVIRSLQISHSEIDADNEFSSENAYIPEELKAKPFSYYAGLIAKKDLFKMTLEVKKETPKALMQAGPLELLNNYSLSGVVSGESPQAIIEDKKSRKAYFLNKGQYLGEFRIEDIMEGKVILDFNGQKFELSL